MGTFDTIFAKVAAVAIWPSVSGCPVSASARAGGVEGGQERQVAISNGFDIVDHDIREAIRKSAPTDRPEINPGMSGGNAFRECFHLRAGQKRNHVRLPAFFIGMALRRHACRPRLTRPGEITRRSVSAGGVAG